MKKLLVFTLVLMTGILLNGCGLTSGTLFIAQDVDGQIVSNSASSSTLDEAFGHVIVNFTDNADWQDYNIEGIEDGCIVMDVWNELTTTVSGEVWITLDTLAISGINSVADIEAAGGFRVFSGILIPAGPDVPGVDPATYHFTCAETFALLENVDQLVAAMQQGYFVAWGAANEDTFNFTYDGIVFGAHVTGSL
ncbi:hypothetical protein KKH18_02315 [bacterium]|nr:hypothetical protein [bacterium]